MAKANAITVIRAEFTSEEFRDILEAVEFQIQHASIPDHVEQRLIKLRSDLLDKVE